MRRFITSYTRTLLTRHRERANILSVLQRISCVCAHRSKTRPPAASTCAKMGTRSGSTASGETQGRRSVQIRPGTPTCGLPTVEPRTHTTPLTRCSTSEVARRQSTPEKVPGLRAQADAWGKVSGARKGPCARLSGECGRLVLTLCYRRYRRLTFGLEVTLFTPRAARSIRGAGGHCDSHGLRLEELRLLLDDLSCAMPASSASERLERPLQSS